MLKSIKKNRKPKVWLFPHAIEREYVGYLRGVARNINTMVNQKLVEIRPHFQANIRQDSFSDTLERWLIELLQAVLIFVDEKEIAQFVRGYIHQTENFNGKQFHKVLKSVYSVDVFTTEPWLDDALKIAEWENIRLIKSLPTQTLEKLRSRFTQAVRGGWRWESVVDDVKSILNTNEKRATLIARDQIGKLNGHLTKLRQQNIGVKSYIWRGMLDERERAHHVDREGKQFDWDNPPDDGHPGEPILCRCDAEAVFPEFEDLGRDDAEPIDPISTTKTGKMNLDELFDNSLSGGGNKSFSNFGLVDPALVTLAKESIGLDISDWRHSIDESSIRHILKQHGNEKAENKRGQRAVTKADILMLPQIVSSFDSIDYTGTSDAGSETFLLRKEIGDEIFCVQEVRKRHKKIAVKTMWIRKKKKP
ncbi:Phage Mu protein F like protein [Haemophilus influenzae]|nr:Phage Mu protein F like protein [Haemophilus influenzae]PRJ51264.1 Phage Mu protein F like protein [Haemophilus influenzae]PRK30607.1 Phage Mu protein F like protein [Haemophilus influenzae]PRK31547.1 Phage Mu protein F like protein [Haemophilus influenzae]PRK88160.1 Phage Mu protein F like protein [Haemophilus influenzae]